MTAKEAQLGRGTLHWDWWSSFYSKAHTGTHPHSANTGIMQQMTPGPFVGLLFQHTHSTLASSCPATGDALSCWQGSTCVFDKQLVVCVCVCVLATVLFVPFSISYQLPFTKEWISRVKFHQIPNKNPSIQHLVVHHTHYLSFIYHHSTLPSGRLVDAKGWCWER